MGNDILEERLVYGREIKLYTVGDDGERELIGTTSFSSLLSGAPIEIAPIWDLHDKWNAYFAFYDAKSRFLFHRKRRIRKKWQAIMSKKSQKLLKK